MSIPPTTFALDKRRTIEMAKAVASMLLAVATTLYCSVAVAEQTLESLGAYYFGTAKISSDNELSCSACHEPRNAWQDGYERALARHIVLSRNTPTIYNVRRYRYYFWDGRSASLEEQISGPLFARVEINSSKKQLIAATEDCPEARKAWQQSRLSIREFVRSALAAYMLAVSKGTNRFEEFLAGRATLASRETYGYRLFTSTFGCASCHRLPNLTDDKFHDIGLPRRKLILQSMFDGKAGPRRTVELGYDYGRANISDEKKDLHAFRTPSLFLVTKTAPYMHNGMFHSLSEVLDFYSRKRVASGRPPMTEKEKDALLALFQAFSDFNPATPPASPCPVE